MQEAALHAEAELQELHVPPAVGKKATARKEMKNLTGKIPAAADQTVGGNEGCVMKRVNARCRAGGSGGVSRRIFDNTTLRLAGCCRVARCLSALV